MEAPPPINVTVGADEKPLPAPVRVSTVLETEAVAVAAVVKPPPLRVTVGFEV